MLALTDTAESFFFDFVLRDVRDYYLALPADADRTFDVARFTDGPEVRWRDEHLAQLDSVRAWFERKGMVERDVPYIRLTDEGARVMARWRDMEEMLARRRRR